MRSFGYLATVCLVLASAPVLAQGYDGLFAADDAAPARAAPVPADQTPGYQGLIPGTAPAVAPAVRPVAPTGAAPVAAVPQKIIPRPVRVPGVADAAPVAGVAATPVPGSMAAQPIRSSTDLVRLAQTYSFGEGAGDISDELAARARLPASTTELLKQPRPRINGMLPMENNVKSSIDATMSSLRTKNLRPEDRAARVKLARDSLSTLKRGLSVKNSVSDRTYTAMGMPPMYIKEEREAVQKSLAHIDAALAQLDR